MSITDRYERAEGQEMISILYTGATEFRDASASDAKFEKLEEALRRSGAMDWAIEATEKLGGYIVTSRGLDSLRSIVEIGRAAGLVAVTVIPMRIEP